VYLGGLLRVPLSPLWKWENFCTNFNMKNMLKIEYFWNCTPEIYPDPPPFRFLNAPLGWVVSTPAPPQEKWSTRCGSDLPFRSSLMLCCLRRNSNSDDWWRKSAKNGRLTTPCLRAPGRVHSRGCQAAAAAADASLDLKTANNTAIDDSWKSFHSLITSEFEALQIAR